MILNRGLLKQLLQEWYVFKKAVAYMYDMKFILFKIHEKQMEDLSKYNLNTTQLNNMEEIENKLAQAQECFV